MPLKPYIELCEVAKRFYIASELYGRLLENYPPTTNDLSLFDEGGAGDELISALRTMLTHTTATSIIYTVRNEKLVTQLLKQLGASEIATGETTNSEITNFIENLERVIEEYRRMFPGWVNFVFE